MPATPNTQDLRAALSKTLHSAAFGKFMTQCIAQAIEETAHQPGQIVLTGGALESACSILINSRQAEYIALDDSQARRAAVIWRDTDRRYWAGCEYAYDATGHQWTRNISKMVADDFGTLVEVVQ